MNYKTLLTALGISLFSGYFALNTTGGQDVDIRKGEAGKKEWKKQEQVDSSWYNLENLINDSTTWYTGMNTDKKEGKLNWFKIGDKPEKSVIGLIYEGEPYLIIPNLIFGLDPTSTSKNRYWEDWERIIRSKGYRPEDTRAYLIPNGPSFTMEKYNADSTNINEEIIESVKPYYPHISPEDVSINVRVREVTKEELDSLYSSFEGPDFIKAVKVGVADIALESSISSSKAWNKKAWYDPSKGGYSKEHNPLLEDIDGGSIADVSEVKDKSGKVIKYNITYWTFNDKNK